MKNTLAPINRIPQEVLSLIPGYCNTDEELVALTHVCRGWREQFTSRASLWTSLDCTNIEQTREYLERSKTSPLEIQLEEGGHYPFLNDAFLLTVPHLGRLKSLSLSGSSNDLLELTRYFGSPAPLLEKLKLSFTCTETPVIQDAIFDGDLSSLCELRLSGVIANLAWTDLSNLVTFDLRRVPSNKISVTQLLNFFERAPLLRKIHLRDAFPNLSDAPPGRVVTLPHLKYLTIAAQPAHAILLNHLSIPNGASLKQEFDFSDDKSLIPTYLPKTYKNLKTLSHINSINLSFGSGVFLRLSGPSGMLYVLGNWVGATPALPTLDHRILRFLTLLHISTTESLVITDYRDSLQTKIEKSPIYLALVLTNNLRVLMLTDCDNLPFIFTLNPKKNPSKTVVCPKLEELVLYIADKDRFVINELLEMVEERASSCSKLSAITIVSSQEFVPAKKVLKLRNHVSRVEYKLDDVELKWDDTLDDDLDISGNESDW